MSGVCPSCGAVQSQAWLCHDCSAALETLLGAAPQLLEQLDVAISKQAKAGGNGKAGKGTARERSPINFGALAVRDALMVELAFVGEDVNWVRSHPQAGEMLAKLGTAVKDAYRAIDRMQERTYLGVCMFEEGGLTCHAEIWARPGARTVTCSQCEITHEVTERRAWLLDRAGDMLVTVREAASYVGSYGDMVVSESTIRSYLGKGLIAYHGKIDGVGVFRMGELMQLIATHAERKGGRPLRRASA